VNIGQAFLIASDNRMYQPDLDCPCVARTSTLCQELGMVSNIFSDKTGTLTRNEMKLVKFVVDGTFFDVVGPGGDGLNPSSGVMQAIHSRGGQKSAMYGFMRCLTACHTVIREKDGKYRAESPDELALIEGVEGYGCGLQERGTTSMLCTLLGERVNYEVLAVNAFNADRKRMSIVIRDVATDEYFCLCKGADNMMLPLCEIDPAFRKNIDKYLLDLACLGLRTLCIAQKRLTKDQAMNWLDSFRQAESSLQGRADKLAQVGGDLEMNMEFLGITAIEDRLQDEVPEVIADLAKAGIVLWMLTGDKEETAVNIGHSCNLILNNTKTFFLTKVPSEAQYTEQLREIHDDIVKNTSGGNGYLDEQHGQLTEVVFVMDGPSFKYFDEENAEHRKHLLRIGQSCRSVIACRLTPVQKQQVVGLVKKDSVPAATTLAIGDGANDCSMIMEANVGVGIFGKEGRQAANNSDFAIGEFKFLRRLLLIHGRWNYSRQSRVFLYSVHKNMVISFSLFWYRFVMLIVIVFTSNNVHVFD
jgi:phospholipid-translocating P-type ATPase (flippase)